MTLTRKEAGVLAGIDVEDPVISDERYRQFLKYQMLVNTNECTYHDLMDGLALLWDVSPIYYREDPALPAVIILTMPFLTPGGKVVTLGEVPMVKPAGVRIEFEYYIKAIVEVAFNFWISSYEVPRCNTIVCGTHPKRATLGILNRIPTSLQVLILSIIICVTAFFAYISYAKITFVWYYLATNSPCNKTGDEITVKGSMLHSVGCPQPKPEVFAKIWETSTGACVHAVTGADAYAIQCLPLFPERKKARRGWHGASGKNGSVNNTHLSLEMTEPATIKYVGGATWIETGDGSNTKRHVLATYANAVQVFAKWCKEFGLNPLEDGVIISHHEGNQRGIASNHGDVEHIWNKFGLTMDQFREDVKKAMGGQAIDTVPDAPVDNSSDDTSSQAVNPLSGSVKIIYTGDDGLNVRKAPCILDKYVDHVEHAGTFTVVGISADEKWYKLKSGLFITTIPEYVSFKATPEQKQQTAGTGYYRVRKNWDDAGSQIGAFKNQNNAIELCKQNSGYKVFDNDGNEIYPCIKDDGTPFKFRVTIPDLRIRKGPGTTYDYWKKNGSPEYTGKNVFTIIDTAEGPGAKIWGLLKSGEKDRDRWISLDEDYGNRL